MSDSGSNDGRMSDAEEDDDDHDLVGGENPEDAESEEEEAPAPEPAPAADSVEGSAQLYILYNRQCHLVSKTDGTTPGWKRCYNRIVKVSSGEALGSMVASEKGWPKGDALTRMVGADKVVVLYGKMKEEDEDLVPIWYLLMEVEGVANKQDHQIARHIPKPVYKDLIDAIKKDKAMEESSLLRMQAYGDNAKPLNPVINGFKKVTGDAVPKSACVMPKPVEKPKKDGEGSSKDGPAKKKQKKDDKPADAAPEAAPRR